MHFRHSNLRADLPPVNEPARLEKVLHIEDARTAVRFAWCAGTHGAYASREGNPHAKRLGVCNARMGSPQHQAVSESDLAAREDLLRFLEQSSGRRIRTKEDIRSYIEELSRRSTDDRAARRWQKAKTLTLAVLGVFAILQYFVIDTLLQIVSMPQLTVFVHTGAKTL